MSMNPDPLLHIWPLRMIRLEISIPKILVKEPLWTNGSVEQNYYDAAEKIVAELIFKQFRQLPADEAVVTAQEKRLHEVLVVINKQLGQTAFLAGDHFTIADIVYVPYTEKLVGIPRFHNLLEQYPHFGKWWKSISDRPAWKKVIALK